jgi:fructose-specific phosphotransferase system IIC component
MKKAFGVLLILLAVLISLGLFAFLVNLLLNNRNEIQQENTAYSLGFIIASFIVFLLFATFNFALYFFGFKLLKTRQKPLSIADKNVPSSK